MRKVRIVHNLSRPVEGSVNYFTEIEHRKFATIRQACEMMQPKGMMAKIYLSKAYRSLPTAPRYWRIHVLQWRNMVYADLRVPFGNRAAPGVFDRLITQFVVRIARTRGISDILGYIDDFWVHIKPK